ncbi:MAG: 4-hydroxythreonine-4-phosphate dehydrogenase PdxA [Bryobacteraceae bacterium]
MTDVTETLPAIAITMGDPAGVGPEIVVKALADRELVALARWLVVGDPRILEMAETIAGTKLEGAERIDVDALGDVEDFGFGRLDARCGRAGVAYVRAATELCLAGKAEAMVTAPLNKEAVALSGMAFSGHTEYIAQLCGASESRMLLASERLATVHVTTHVPLRQACDVTAGRVARTIELGDDAMKLLGFARPRIAVCGLNPHAGEHGLFGAEDERTILPAIQAARAKGIDCSGPHAPDSIFLQASRGAYDLVVPGHSHYSDIGGSWHGIRHRRHQPRQPAQHEAGHAHGRPHGRDRAGNSRSLWALSTPR